MTVPGSSTPVPALTNDDLPLWMRQAHRRIDWGIILALAIALLAIWPFIIRGGLPRGTALELYAYRAAEMADVMGQGVLYPRWAPDLLYGYGLPLFNYASPGSLFLALLFRIATEGSVVDGIRFVLIASSLLGSAGLFLFIRHRWGPVSGLVAVSLYTLSPQIVFLLPFISGDLPLLLALQLLPIEFWALDRALGRGRAVDAGLLAAVTAGLLMADERVSPWLMALVILWMIWLWLTDRQPYTLFAWGCLLLGIGLAAAYWMPAVLERDLPTWRVFGAAMPAPPLTMGELLSASTPVDFGAFNPFVRRNLGLALWLYALAAVPGVIGRLRHRQGQKLFLEASDRAWLFFALVSIWLFAVFLAGALNALLPQVVIGLLLFPLAVMAARVAIWLERLTRARTRLAALALLLAIPFLGALPLLHAPEWPADFGSTDVIARLQLELEGYALGTVPPGQPIPFPADILPQPSRALIESYYTRTVDKVNREALVSGQVEAVQHQPASEQVLVRADTPFVLPFYISQFEGWQIRVDNTPAEARAGPDGLLQADIPAGVHTVYAYLETTAAQQVADAATVVSIFLLAGVMIWRTRQRLTAGRESHEHLLSRTEAIASTGALAGAIILLILLSAQPGILWMRSLRGAAPENQTPFRYFTRAGIDMLGYDLRRVTYTPGEDVDLTLFWRAVRPMNENLQVLISLADAETGERVVQSYKRHVGDYPTSRWPTNRYVRDRHLLTIPVGAQPGTYLLLLDLWRCENVLTGNCPPEEQVAFFGDYGVSVGLTLALPAVITIK